MGVMRVGLDGVFNWGVKGSKADTEAENVDNVNFSGGTTEATRVKRHATFESSKVVLLTGSLKFDVQDEIGDAFFAAVETAWIGKTTIALHATRASSGKGLDADFTITAFDVKETNSEFSIASVEAKPNDELRDPVWQA